MATHLPASATGESATAANRSAGGGPVGQFVSLGAQAL